MAKKKKGEKAANDFLDTKEALELKKLKIEVDEAEFKQSPSNRKIEKLKAYAGVSGLVTGLVAMFTIGFSVFQWAVETEQNRIVRIEERLDKTIINLGNKLPQTRLASVIALSSFLKQEHQQYHSQVMLSLVNMLSNEKDSGVRSAIVQVLDKAENGTVSKEVFETSLLTLINFSRFHLETGELYDKREFNEFKIPEGSSQEAIARDISKGIIGMMKKGILIKDLSRFFCVKCDFTGLKLDGVSFEDAVLTWSDFSGVNLRKANFDGADLESTKFIEADLDSAIFTYNAFKQDGYRLHYIEQQMNRDVWQPAVLGPDFTGANLSNAVFTGHILFGFSNESAEYGVMIFNPSFASANLTNTDFRTIGIYGTTFPSKHSNGDLTIPFFPLRGKAGIPIGRDSLTVEEIRFYQFTSLVFDTSQISKDMKYFLGSSAEIYSLFANANWEAAKWPPAFREMMENEKRWEENNPE